LFECQYFRGAPTWLTTALVEWNALLTILVADIVSVTMPLMSIIGLAVAVSTRAGPAEDETGPGCL